MIYLFLGLVIVRHSKYVGVRGHLLESVLSWHVGFRD